MQWLNIAEWMIHWIFNRQLQVACYSAGFSLASTTTAVACYMMLAYPGFPRVKRLADQSTSINLEGCYAVVFSEVVSVLYLQ